MPGTLERTYSRDEVFPSYQENVEQEFMAALGRFRLEWLNDTTIRVPAGAGADEVAFAVQGRMRFNVANVDRAHPGGAAAVYDIYVTAAENDIDNTPQTNTDNTVRTFALAIVAHNATPAIVPGTVDIFAKVGELDWDGAKITGLRRTNTSTLTTAALEPTARRTNDTPVRVHGIAAMTVPLTIWDDPTSEVARIERVGGAPALTLNADASASLVRSAAGTLRATGALSAAGALTAADGGATSQVRSGALGPSSAASVQFGSPQDVQLYRSGAGALRSDGSLSAVSDITGRVGAASQALLGAAGPSSEAGISLGSGADAALYRSGSGALKTGGTMTAAGGYLIGTPLTGTPAYQSQQVAAQTVIRNKLLSADANDAFRIRGDGKYEWGAGGGTAVDTNLYRSAASTLKTDSSLYVVGELAANQGAANQIFAASDGKIYLGSALDTNLYRSAADTLKTDDSFVIGPTGKTALTLPSTGSNTGLTIGGDATLYRSGALTLKTDGALVVGADFVHQATSLGFLGFYGSSAVKQTVTGSRAGNAALASLLTALANYGLVVNSSSA